MTRLPVSAADGRLPPAEPPASLASAGAPARGCTGWRAAFTGLLLGPEGRQRVRTSQTLLSLVVIALYAVVQWAEVRAGLMDATEARWFNTYNLSWALMFYLVIRSGLNLRLSDEPALTLPQCLFALVGGAWAYGISGPSRGAMVVAVMLVLIFGIFGLRVGQSRFLAGLAFTLLALVMAYKSSTDPHTYDPRVEWVHLVLAAIFVAAVAVLAGRLSRMRQRLSQQKADLQQALVRIQELATRDPLTGLLNRRAMGEMLGHEAARAARLQAPLGLVLFDLDHFKRINDHLGHAVGDEVLQAFARLAGERIRKTDALARWGGEEFLLMLPDTPLDGALKVAERIRLAVAAWRPAVAADWPVSLSGGVTACVGADDLDAALDRADRALYRAKHLGRNQVLLSSEAPGAAAEVAPGLGARSP